MQPRLPTFSPALLFVIAAAAGGFSPHVHAEVPDTTRLKMEEWASNGMTKDPVALAFDRDGRLYLVESARRGSVDIDIRAHRSWLLDDLASDDFSSMRDFFRAKMATSLSSANKEWLQDRNGDRVHDYRDLTTISERIRILEDTDQDGKADKSILYAEGFNEEFTGVAAGILPYEGDVLFTVYPDLWRLRDLDGDGRADGRVSMFRGFGVHAAFDGHDLHGLTVGPEGKIYFSCGDNGFSVVTREGKRLHYPNTGGVLRMNPDGSDLEVYAYGLRNVQEFDFDPFGNMFGVDNDGDLEDERERAVYIAEGSDSGWRLNWQFRSPGWKQYNGGMTYNPWTAEGMWKPPHSKQPAYITPPMQNYSVGPGGFKFNPGTALNDEYRDFFFCVQFPVKQITAFRTRPNGAGFEMFDEHVFNAGLMVSSLNFGPDGGCYLADWVGKWQPNLEGVVYRVDDPEVRGSAIRGEVQQYIRAGVASESTTSLVRLLGHSDRRVRQLAQFELVRRKSGRTLLDAAKAEDSEQLARIHAIWGLIQLRDVELADSVLNELPWTDEDPQIRQQCARAAGDLRLHAREQLIRQLNDSVALVRSHAAIALGKVGDARAVAPLLGLLRRNADLDPFIRHGAVMGLSGSATDAELAAQVHSESAAVRMGATLALRRKKSPRIAAFLWDPSLRVAREAVRGVHDDLSIPGALPAVARMLASTDLPNDEPILRRVISANLRVGDHDSAERLVRFVIHPPDLGELAEPMQLEALECLAKWDASPLVDRVVGRVRDTRAADSTAGRRVFAQHLDTILEKASPAISDATLRFAADLRIDIAVQKLRSWVTSPGVSSTTRSLALRALVDRNDEHASKLIAGILSERYSTKGDHLWRTAFALQVDADPKQSLKHVDMQGSTAIRQFFIHQLSLMANADADAILKSEVDQQLRTHSDSGVMLELLQAARSREIPIANELEQLVAGAKYKEYQFALAGGSATRGERIYKNHVSAQCVRCHNAGGAGNQAGPELKGIGKQDRTYLLQAIVDPSVVIAKGFESVAILTDDGELVHGTVVAETETEVRLAQADGKTVSVRKASIEDRSDSNQSAMPKMTDVLSPFEVRDLVEYLSTLK